jgi:hypothetical protein
MHDICFCLHDGRLLCIVRKVGRTNHQQLLWLSIKIHTKVHRVDEEDTIPSMS